MEEDPDQKGGAEGQQQQQRRRRKGGVGRILKWENEVPFYPIPNGNYASILLDTISQHGEKIALVDATNEKSYTYGDLRLMVLRMKTGLEDAGVRPGDSVILMSGNHIDMPVVCLSIMLAGAVYVPINPALTTVELTRIASISQAKWAVASEKAVGLLEAAFSSLGPGTLKQIWVLSGASRTARPPLRELMKSVSPELMKMDEGFDSAKTVAMMPFSSGTTGLPKGVMLSHQNLLVNYARKKYQEIRDPNSINHYKSTLLFLPMYHIYGYNYLINTLITGGKVVILPKFSPKQFFEIIQRHQVTLLPVVPYIMKFMSETPLKKHYDLSSLKLIITGSSPISGTTLNDVMIKSGKPVGHGYALTEAAGLGTGKVGPPGFKSNSVGKVYPYIQAKVIDVETGRLLDEGEEGELCLKGPSIMLGYANNPEASAEAIDSEGWLHTGDICYYDEDDFVFITDRIKDLIKVKGYQISPAELENIIRQFKGVRDVAVVGVPNERLGEAPRAWVVLAQDAIIDTHALIKHVADQVAPYKQLAGGVEVVKSLPKNHLGKILRRQLKRSLKDSRSKL